MSPSNLKTVNLDNWKQNRSVKHNITLIEAILIN